MSWYFHFECTRKPICNGAQIVFNRSTTTNIMRSMQFRWFAKYSKNDKTNASTSLHHLRRNKNADNRRDISEATTEENEKLKGKKSISDGIKEEKNMRREKCSTLIGRFTCRWSVAESLLRCRSTALHIFHFSYIFRCFLHSMIQVHGFSFLCTSYSFVFVHFCLLFCCTFSSQGIDRCGLSVNLRRMRLFSPFFGFSEHLRALRTSFLSFCLSVFFDFFGFCCCCPVCVGRPMWNG